MKVVCSGDWHGDWVTLGVPRFDEVARAVDHSVDEAIRIGAGLYVFNGDLAETEGPGMLRTLELAVRLAGKLWQSKIRSLWLTGNHDIIEDGLRTSNLTPLRDVPGATLVDSACIELVGQRSEPMPFTSAKMVEHENARRGKCVLRVACLPFAPRSHNYDPVAFVREHASEPVDLVVGHLMLEGIGPGSETRDMPRGRDVFWPLEEIDKAWPGAVKVGSHYHRRQVYRGVHLPGSLVRLTQAEASNEPGFLVVDL